MITTMIVKRVMMMMIMIKYKTNLSLGNHSTLSAILIQREYKSIRKVSKLTLKFLNRAEKYCEKWDESKFSSVFSTERLEMKNVNVFLIYWCSPGGIW